MVNISAAIDLIELPEDDQDSDVDLAEAVLTADAASRRYQTRLGERMFIHRRFTCLHADRNKWEQNQYAAMKADILRHSSEEGDEKYEPGREFFAELLITPRIYDEAVSDDDRRFSKHAIDDELQVRVANKVWKDRWSVPEGHEALGCRWIFKIKRNADPTAGHASIKQLAGGSWMRFKARIVVKGLDLD